MKRPSWDKAPPEAMWCAYDKDGTYHWFENKPKRQWAMPFWMHMGGRYVLAEYGDGGVHSHWKESLRRRP